MIFSHFKHYFIFLNINEHLAVLFFELAKSESRVSHSRSSCLHKISCLGIPTVTQAESYLLLLIFLGTRICSLFVCMVDETQII